MLSSIQKENETIKKTIIKAKKKSKHLEEIHENLSRYPTKGTINEIKKTINDKKNKKSLFGSEKFSPDEVMKFINQIEQTYLEEINMVNFFI